MARDRSDIRWTRLRSPWERLRWARETHGGYPTPTSFARAMQMTPHTYAAYERDRATASKAIGLDLTHARDYAKKLDVRWEWLLDGAGAPWRDGERELSPEGRSVGELIDEYPVDERAAIVDAVRTILRRAG